LEINGVREAVSNPLFIAVTRLQYSPDYFFTGQAEHPLGTGNNDFYGLKSLLIQTIKNVITEITVTLGRNTLFFFTLTSRCSLMSLLMEVWLINFDPLTKIKDFAIPI
jgi:hypothetical protein